MVSTIHQLNADASVVQCQFNQSPGKPSKQSSQLTGNQLKYVVGNQSGESHQMAPDKKSLSHEYSINEDLSNLTLDYVEVVQGEIPAKEFGSIPDDSVLKKEYSEVNHMRSVERLIVEKVKVVQSLLEKVEMMFYVTYEHLDDDDVRHVLHRSLEGAFFAPIWSQIIAIYRCVLRVCMQSWQFDMSVSWA